MGRTVAELEDSLSYGEWVRWLAFHSLFDLPDGFLVAGQLGSLVSHALGGKGKAADFAPFYTLPPRVRSVSSLKDAFNFLRSHVPHKRRKPG